MGQEKESLHGNHCDICMCSPEKHGEPGFFIKTPCIGLKTNICPVYLIQIPKIPSLLDKQAFFECLGQAERFTIVCRPCDSSS